MIERRERFLFALICIEIAALLPVSLAKPLFFFGLRRRVSKYRINGGAWESYKSAAHNASVRLFAGLNA